MGWQYDKTRAPADRWHDEPEIVYDQARASQARGVEETQPLDLDKVHEELFRTAGPEQWTDDSDLLEMQRNGLIRYLHPSDFPDDVA